MHRIFLSKNQITPEFFSLEQDNFNHLIKVNRVQPKEKIEIVLEKNIKIVQITKIENNRIFYLQLEEKTVIPSKTNLYLAQSLPKQDKFSDIIKFTVPFGVNQIFPIISERSLVKLNAKEIGTKITRWQKIVKETAMQAKIDYLAEIQPVQTIKEFLSSQTMNNFDLKLAFWEVEQTNLLKNILQKHQDKKNILVLIGPEGGFSENEIKTLQTYDFISVSLGKMILRTELAGLTALAMINFEKS